ncbi:MAG: class I SAM-dependent methyltransferase [Candidatus Aquicultor sp.]
MQSEKVHFTEEKETMLMTLYARALQSRSKDPILQDKWAEDAVDRIDYDFGKFKVGKLRALLIAIRAKQLDLWTTRYLADHPDATVLHLGCGLDSRVYRIDPPEGVRWFDVDYPEVIELRRRLYPERAGYRMIGSSLADLGWLDEVPGDRLALIVAEGVTMYLTEDVMKLLLNRLTAHFPCGQIAFDVLSSQSVRWMAKTGGSVKGTSATFSWGIDDPQDIKKLEPRLDLIADLRAPHLAGFSRMPWVMRALVRMMDSIPALQRMRCLLYRF